MGARHDAREWAVQFLFQREFNTYEMEKALEDFWAERKASESMRKFAEKLIWGVEQHKDEIDKQLKVYAEHWDINRMGIVDRTVIRVAMYEMIHCPDVPPVVAINEAVEVAKDLSSNESGRFVNGILDRALKDIDRPAREGIKRRKAPAQKSST
ncbi:MAG: transcription antitermination factor NusB [Spartobacteria bacterium]|nr:transcription antitermination factor NusB [Spartobacteria bacterium]